jgi:hypothetical protein
MDQARFALHAAPNTPIGKCVPTGWCGDCTWAPSRHNIACSEFTITKPTNEFPGSHVYLMIGHAGAIGIQGASCGIDYRGADGVGIDPKFVTFGSCADMVSSTPGENGDWPTAGSSISVTWTECQMEQIGGEGVQTALGAIYVYAYSEDVLRVTPVQEPNEALTVRDCQGVTTDLLDLVDPELYSTLTGRVHYGGDGTEAYNPCLAVKTRNTTWGAVKSLY